MIPTQAISAIKDEDFTIFESHTILKYIVRTHNLHQFCPQDTKQQALVDAYIDWHHTGTRNITLFFRAVVLGHFFMNQFQFIQNQPTLSIADLSLINELVGLFSMNYDFNQHPVLKKYVEHLLSVPEIREINKDFFGFLGRFQFVDYDDFVKQYL